MKTFEIFFDGLKEIPLATSWLLNDIAEMKGRQQLFYAQSAHKLNTLKEHAIIESSKMLIQILLRLILMAKEESDSKLFQPKKR